MFLIASKTTMMSSDTLPPGAPRWSATSEHNRQHPIPSTTGCGGGWNVGERSKEKQEEGHTCTMAGGCHVSRVDFEGCAFVLDYCTHM
jgi:hypothetical protein